MNIITKNRTRRLLRDRRPGAGRYGGHEHRPGRCGQSLVRRTCVHGEAAVTCTSGSARLMSATPRMGTSVGYEFGQNVAWRFTIVNVATGATVWSDPSLAHGAHLHRVVHVPSYYGHTNVQVKAFADLPDMSWTMAPGRYRVLTDYAWLTTKGWSYSTWRAPTATG